GSRASGRRPARCSGRHWGGPLLCHRRRARPPALRSGRSLLQRARARRPAIYARPLLSQAFAHRIHAAHGRGAPARARARVVPTRLLIAVGKRNRLRRKVMAKAIPEGLRTITPQVAVEGCADAIEFWKRAFGAQEVMRAPDPTGKKIWHSQLKIGDSAFFA